MRYSYFCCDERLGGLIGYMAPAGVRMPLRTWVLYAAAPELFWGADPRYTFQSFA